MAQGLPLPDPGARGVATSLNRGNLKRLVRAVRAMFSSEIGGKVRLRFVGILLLLLVINSLNVVNSYVGRNLFTAIEQRSLPSFFSMAMLWIVVFAALTCAAVLLRFIEEHVALLWRDWLTWNLVGRYLHGGVYLRLKEQGQLDNPDQRITEDVKAFTTTTLSFSLMFLNAVFTILAFSGVLWSISKLLFLVAVGYAALGSLFTIVLGRPLVRLNYDQADREASFRSELMHVGQNAESVALLQLERRLTARLRRRLGALIANAKRIIGVHRNLGFFTTGYNYGIQLVPALFVGPLFIHGKVEFGVITQSAMAFSQLLGAFSLIVTQFQSISSYAAVLARIGSFETALAQTKLAAQTPRSNEAADRLIYEDLTLTSASSGETLVAHLSLTVESGTRLLVTGTDEARRELFRATALGRDGQEGSIVCPAAQRTLFLPERPYIPFGTLRELIVGSYQEREVRDDEIHSVLRELGLAPVVKRLGGLDVERDWSHALSLGEQQLLSVAHVVLANPAFAVLQSPGTTLAPEQLAQALRLLSKTSITYLALGGADAPASAYDAVLELRAGGSWTLRPCDGDPAAAAGGQAAS